MRVFYGKVTSITEASDSCRCFSDDAKFYVAHNNVFDHVEDYGTYKYYVLPELIPGVEEGMYDQFTPDYEEIYNHCVKSYLESVFEVKTEETFKSTCYSEWTCGYPGYVTTHRLGELENLEGKIVAFFS